MDKDFKNMSEVEKELYRGIDRINISISGLNRDYRDNKNLSRTEYLNYKNLVIDSNAMASIREAKEVLNDIELARFVRLFLHEVDTLKNGKATL
jgi:hypothetical protein